MSVSFTYVPPIAPGTPVSSTHLSKVADAFNDRLRSGLADGPWRIVFSALAMFRQIRNSDENGFLFPPQHEFFTAYQNITADEFRWPMVEPGEAEGINVASLMGGFIFGIDAINLYSEDIRVSDEVNGGVPLWLGLTVPETPEELWELGKNQRGAYDPHTGYIASPSFRAATEHYKLQPYLTSPHGNTYGGYMPTPEFGPDCTEPGYVNYLVFFTNLNTGEILSYPGTCGDDPTHVSVVRGSRYYIVFKNDGSAPDILLFSEWVEGPYSGGAWISKQPGGHIPRVLNAFTSDFRGTPEQIQTQESWLEHAFDTQRFLETQYYLAPQKGNVDEFTGGPIYPRWEATGHTTYAEGETIFNVQMGERYFYTEGFVCVSAFIKATGLAGSASIEFLESGDVIKAVEIEADENGDFSQIVMFDLAFTPNYLAVRWASDARFTSAAGKLEIETTEILRYKPELYDLYLCLRLGSCRVNLVDGMDGSGLSEESANVISDAYFANGCITNVNGSSGPAGYITEANTNAVFDAARRLSKFVHVVPRYNLRGYEVSGGKSIVYFAREGPGGQDLFDGIGPSRDRVFTGSIEADKRYVVRSGMVTYRSVNYVTGQVFTGVHPTTAFQGDGEVYEYDGIYHTAPREGLTNEWLMGHQFKVYHNSDSSIWKPDAYSDWAFLVERCHLDSATGITQDLRLHFAFGESLLYFPEAPTGWRYVKNTNAFPCGAGDVACEDARRDRYKSCRIYEPDPEIESATVQIENGEEIIKLVFTTRFHAHESAPASIDRDVSTWNIAALNAESYRTTENGIREYLIWAHYGNNCTPGAPSDAGQQGNAARGAFLWGNPDNPYGSCFPTFYFVKLFPKPYEDGNNSQQSHDTPLMADWWKQADFYIKAMCEGYVDGLTSANIGCETLVNALFDYTFESLCFEAFGDRWFNTLATTPTNYIDPQHTRSDHPEGFGQLPNTILSSEVYNQFAAALNLLNRVRVMLPMEFQTRTASGSVVESVSAQAPDGSPLACSTSGSVAGWWTGAPPDPAVGAYGAWSGATGISAQHAAAIDMFSCDGTSWELTATRITSQWQWQLVDPDAIYAIPEHWRDMITDTSFGRVLAFHETTTASLRVAVADDIGDSTSCAFVAGHWFDGTNYYKFVETSQTTSQCIVLSPSGEIRGPSIGLVDLAIGRAPDNTSCTLGAAVSETITPILGNDTMFIEVPLV